MPTDPMESTNSNLIELTTINSSGISERMSAEQVAALDENADNESSSSSSSSAKLIAASLALFVASGFAEVGGGWLVWQSVREGKPRYWAVLGSLVLVVYGFIPTLQPSEVVDSFGRTYAAYGGFFIILAALWGWALDGDKPDVGDIVGATVALVGVLVMLFWPR